MTENKLSRLFSDTDRVTSEAEAVARIEYPSSEFRGFQGGCSDGRKYYYQTVMHYDFESGQEENYSRIVKVDTETGDTVLLSDDLKLGHANDIAYHPQKGLLLVCHNKPHPERLTLLDAETLKCVGAVDLPFGIYSIDYNSERDMYVVGLSGTRKFRFLDSDMRPVNERVFSCTPLTDRYTKQGVGSDNDFIYFIMWDGKHRHEADFQNVIAAYRWDGSFAGLIEFDVGIREPENISVINGELYAVCGDSAPVVYKITPKKIK